MLFNVCQSGVPLTASAFVNLAALLGVARPRPEPFDEVHPERSRRAQDKVRRRVCDGKEGGVGASPELML